ncbi:MAG: type I methionyl aminopeptidase [Bacteroidetes bacterium GWF2_38_335]|nr:MAG: type I methionyl aminopeptidase [Bacteroidetes bacterium GWF2_38_335]OFY81397.1 MAG: type I methionyl aminopeptidase [Bacteroidetes bacterium RIFOXYA12_FULL_38_20]HBS85520.1 type I methionyl aminopeptidase [Bacteroidales bacterium]
MVFYKTNEEIELLRESNLLVSKTLTEIASMMKPGINTLAIDKRAEEFIRDHGAEPGFKGYNGYPNTLCISVNDQVVHGIPSDYELKEGDIVSVDCGTKKNGFYGDSAYTFMIGEVNADIRKLLKVTRECLYLGIEKAVTGNRVGDISYAIQTHAEANGYSVVRELVGHGVGRQLHEKPEVPNYGRKGVGMKLNRGLVIAIEPMINMGKKEIKQARDGWTISTADKMPSAHFEHTVAIGDQKADILSTFDCIDKEIIKK